MLLQGIVFQISGSDKMMCCTLQPIKTAKFTSQPDYANADRKRQHLNSLGHSVSASEIALEFRMMDQDEDDLYKDTYFNWMGGLNSS